MPKGIREKYKKETGLEPLTKAGAKTKAYTDYLLDPEKCTVPWAGIWIPMLKKSKEKPFKDRETVLADLKDIDRKGREDEKCVRGGVGRGELLKEAAKLRRETKEKFDIPNY